MKKGIFLILFILVGTGAYAMDIKGDFSWETRYSLTNGDFLFNQVNGSLKFEQQANENIYGMAKVSFRYYNNPVGQTTFNSTLSPNELGILYSVQPLEISLDQAYISCKDFLFENLDLSAGKQRITWGTADKLNPTDILNANDFSDPLNYGKKIPTAALNLNYSIPAVNGNIQFVYEPFSPVARLNAMMVSILDSRAKLGTVSNIAKNFASVNAASANWTETISTPAWHASNFTIGTKISATLIGFDLSASYLTRLNDFPELVNIHVDQEIYYNSMWDALLTPNVGTVTINSGDYNMSYYREHVIGFDLSKDIGIVLLWAEASVTFQPEVKTTSTVTSHIYTNSAGTNAYWFDNVANTDIVVLSNEVYVKYTVGFDKTFGDSWYVNFQYNHGFFNERGNNGAERLQDYLQLRFEKKFFSDKLKFALTGMANVNNFYDAICTNDMGAYLTNNYGLMGQFAISYIPFDDLTLEIGVNLFDGKDTTTLGLMKDYDMIFFRCDYMF